MMLLSKKLKAFRVDRPSEWMMDEYARQALRMEDCLLNIRSLLEAQENKECLGIGAADGRAEWPIIDEVINSIDESLLDR